MGLPPDFLWSLVELANFMRLSLLKAAHAVVSGAAYRKSGVRCGGRGAPVQFLMGSVGNLTHASTKVRICRLTAAPLELSRNEYSSRD